MVYILERDSFPKRVFYQEISSLESGFETRGYFTENGNDFVLIVPTQYGGGDSEITYGLAIYMIDFQSEKFVKLNSGNKVSQNIQQSINQRVKDGIFEEKDDVVYLVDASEETLLSIDLNAEIFKIGH